MYFNFLVPVFLNFPGRCKEMVSIQMALTYVTTFNYLFQLCVVNIQSARNKVGDINDILIESNLDFMILTEFWMKPSDADYHVQIGNLDSDCYSIMNQPRKGKKGGGLAVIHKTKYVMREVKLDFRRNPLSILL